MRAMVTVAVIPARGGSRGLPGKNLRSLGREPLIAHTIRAGLGAHGVDRVLVSTDDEAIASVARGCGAEVPFLRPAALAEDATPTAPVVEHAVRQLESAGAAVDVVVTLQPTSPLRAAALVDAALDLLATSGARSVVTVTPLGHPASVIGSLDGGRFLACPLPADADVRRQAAPSGVRITGAVYVTRRDLLAEGRLLDDAPAALLTDGDATIDIDDLAGLRAARRALARPAARRTAG
jgi:CMP-N-acetylneuraminic acid synthetase